MSFSITLVSNSPITVLSGGSVVITPPPSDLPPPTLSEDGSPFIWPEDILTPSDPSERAKAFWNIPGRADDDPTVRIYAKLSGDGKPDSVHFNAGLIQAGPQVGRRAWAPRNSPPELLRAILAGTVAPTS